MKEYIEREALLDALDDLISIIAFSSPYQTDIHTMVIGMNRARDCVEDFDAADVVERKRGEWVKVQCWATKAKYRCSVCGREIMSATKVNMEKYPYCHCGADMRGEKHEAD